MSMSTIPNPWSETSGIMSLQELLEVLRRHGETRIDFVSDLRSLHLKGDYWSGDQQTGVLVMDGQDHQTREFITDPHVMSRRALVQLGERFDPPIPSRFGTELAQKQPRIAADLYNSLIGQSWGRTTRVLVRCLNRRVRAILSARYRIFDDLDIALTCLSAVRDHGAIVLQCTASESSFDIRITIPALIDVVNSDLDARPGSEVRMRNYLSGASSEALARHARPGTVMPFVRIRHSSVGEGGLRVDYGLLRVICLNGLVMDTLMHQVHLGHQLDHGILSEEAIAADSRAVMLKARDLILSACSQERFFGLVRVATRATDDVIEAPVTAVNNIVKVAGLSQRDRDSILEHFLGGPSRSRWDLSQAIARHAQDAQDGIRMGELESLAGQVLYGSGQFSTEALSTADIS